MLARRECQTEGMDALRSRLSRARLYLVCGAPTDDLLEASLQGGVDIVQLRCKDAAEAEIVSAASRVAAACRRHGALFILNDRPELVQATGADGVHVGQDDVSVAAARERVGAHRLVGLSTHTPDQVDAAGDADYIGVGPVHATPTKPGRPAVGLGLVSHAAAHSRVPFFAIGGIAPGNIAAVTAAGARRVAVVRALTDSPDPELTARELRAALPAGEPAAASMPVQEAGVGAA